MNKSQSTNPTIKYTDVDISQLKFDNVTLGKDKNKRVHTMVRYGPYNKELVIQGPWMKMTQHGLLPGQTLKNGEENKYYISEEARGFIKCPLDAENACVTINGKSNSNEVEEFINKVKEMDDYIKNLDMLHKLASIDDDDVEKYNPIYRKPKLNKKAGKDDKTKLSYMKLKIHTNYNNKHEVLTDFYEVDKETSTTQKVKPKGDYMTLSDVDELVSYNCEFQAIFKLVETWSQSLGTWGITTKLVSMRVRKTNKTENKVNTEFIDDDLYEVPTLQPKVESAPAKVAHVKKPVSDDSDEEKPQFTENKTAKKQIAHVDSDDSDESEEEPVIKKKVVKKDVESDDDAIPVKKAVKGKAKK
jgi:hypothetical protein